jgi:tetrahydromethanopterin S-methyltransferase subunit G
MMEKQEFEELVKLLKENNKYLENISSRLDKIDSTLEKIKGETKKKHKSMFDL